MACTTGRLFAQFSFSNSAPPFLCGHRSARDRGRRSGRPAARPHETIRYGVVTAHIHTAPETIVSRMRTLVGQYRRCPFLDESSSKAFNVNPQRVNLLGTVRTFVKRLRESCKKTRDRDSARLATTFGANARVKYCRKLIGDGEQSQTEFSADVRARIQGQM